MVQGNSPPCALCTCESARAGVTGARGSSRAPPGVWASARVRTGRARSRRRLAPLHPPLRGSSHRGGPRHLQLVLRVPDVHDLVVLGAAAGPRRKPHLRRRRSSEMCVRLASTERATARIMQEGSAGRKIRHQPRPLRHPTASCERRNSIAAAHPRPEQKRARWRSRCNAVISRAGTSVRARSRVVCSMLRPKERKEERKGTPVGVVEKGWAVHLPTWQLLARRVMHTQSPALRSSKGRAAAPQLPAHHEALLHVRRRRGARPLLPPGVLHVDDQPNVPVEHVQLVVVLHLRVHRTARHPWAPRRRWVPMAGGGGAACQLFMKPTIHNHLSAPGPPCRPF